MYQYSEKDKQIVKNRTKEFLFQVKRRINGDLTEEEFKPLRLMNGLYLQLHAYMLRVAIPYGELSYIQLKKLAEISEKYDKGYGHFTTRQNIQFNWPKLEDVPKILEELADVDLKLVNLQQGSFSNSAVEALIDGNLNNPIGIHNALPYDIGHGQNPAVVLNYLAYCWQCLIDDVEVEKNITEKTIANAYYKLWSGIYLTD